MSLVSFFVLNVITSQHNLEPHKLGLKIHGKTETILITHGGLANKETMLAYAYAYADLGYSVVIADLPSHGNSEFLMTDVTIKASKKEWENAIKNDDVILAIGHSLGSAFLCPKQPHHIFFRKTYHIGAQCSGRRNIKGSFFKDNFNLPKIDHVLEPWNPKLISEISGNTNKIKVLGYTLLPWSTFIFGLLATIFFQRKAAQIFEKNQNKPYLFGAISAFFLITISTLLSIRTLWFSIPSSISDLYLALLIAIPCLIINYFLTKIAIGRLNHILSILLSISWIFLITYSIAQFWNGWPDYLIQAIYPSLMLFVSLLIFLFIQSCRFQNTISKNTCFIYIMSYLGFILLPNTDLPELIKKILTTYLV